MKNVIFENKTAPFEAHLTGGLSTFLHFHKDIEIIYVISGGTTACADRQRERITSGDLFISFPNQIHHYEDTVIGEYLLLIFSPKILFGLENDIYNYLPETNVIKNAGQKDFTSLFLKTLEFDGKYSDTLTVGLINQAIARLLPELELSPRLKTNDSTLQDILRYCEAHFNENISLDSVASNLHVSKFHVSHLLNVKLGIGFTDYINSLRVNHACDLLEDTDKKIADVSSDSGFGSIRSFNRAFKEIMKTSPTDYRARLVNKS